MRHSYLVASFTAILMIYTPTTSSAETWIVDSQGSGDFTSVQAAIDAAADDDVIEVLSGTYEGALDTLGKSIALVGVDGPEATYLVTSGVDPALTVEGGDQVEIRGFHLSGGNTLANSNFVGGGIHASGATVDLVNLIIEGNTAFVGGGAVLYQAEVTARDLVFINNFASPTSEQQWGQGGAVYGYQSALSGMDISFEGNNARHGGGLVWVEGTLDLDGASFSNNTAEVNGGGAYLRDLEHAADLVDVDFEDNAADSGGAIRARVSDLDVSGGFFSGNSSAIGGALRVDGGGHASVESSAFRFNNADYGGAVLMEESSGAFEKVHFGSNSANLLGGAVYLANSSLAASVSEFRSNSAVSDGGAIRAEGTSSLSIENVVFHGNSGANGGAVHLYDGASAELNHVTIAGNSASSGGSLRVTDESSLVLTNSILSFAEEGSLLSSTAASDTSIEWNNFYAPSGQVVSGGIASPVGGNGNISGDPDFVDFENSTEPDLRLGPDSASVDAADPKSEPDEDGSPADQGAFGGPAGADLDAWSWDDPAAGDDDDDSAAGDDDDSAAGDDDDGSPGGEWQNNTECGCGQSPSAGSGSLFGVALLFALTGYRRRLSSAPRTAPSQRIE